MPETLAAAFRPLRPGYLAMTEETWELREQVEQSAYLAEETARLSEEVKAYLAKYWEIIKKLNDEAHPNLTALETNMLEEIKEILAQHKHLDIYSGYQIIADIWSAHLARDLKIICSEGLYEAARQVEFLTTDGEKGTGEWQGRLLPMALMIERFFASEQKEIDDLREEIQQLESEKQEKIEQGAGEAEDPEASILAAVLNAAGTNFDTKALNQWEKAAEKGSYEKQVLAGIKKLLNDIKDRKKKATEKEIALYQMVLAKYPKLTESEIDELCQRKWFHNIPERMADLAKDPLTRELDILEELAGRYAETLADMDREIAEAEEAFAKLERELVVQG